MLNKILIILAIIIAALFGYASTRPDEFHVSRSVVINAKPAVVFTQVNNLNNWQFWSPWATMDQDIKITLEGPTAGVSSIQHWDGPKAGKGTMTTTESVTDQKIVYRLDFEKPFTATNTATFVFTPQDKGQTEVTWTVEGKNNLLAKIVGLFVNSEKTVGNQFETGLQNLKNMVEGTKG